jgi:hypothetical protein
MNNYYVMSASFEARKNSQATMITAGFAGALLLLMFLWSWTIPIDIPSPPDPGILVELNIPEEPPPPVRSSGGGGGGNIVEASGPAGVAPYSPPLPGTEQDAKDVAEDPTEKESPPILKPDVPKPKATTINENKSPVKTPPKAEPLPPAPPKPKAVLGKTTTGTGTGGGVATTYEKSGGSGPTGNGVGNGPGSGGRSGTGAGGGRGNGIGPQVTNGDRSIVGSYTFEGDLDKATIYADIKVSPDGIGQFLQFARGSSSQNSSYRTAIVEYLRKMRFNRSDHESTVTVRFNFRVNG